MNNNSMYILVADWCPYCREARDVIFKLMENYYDKGNIHLLEESGDDYKKFAIQHQEFGIPSFIIVDENNKKIDSWQGDRSYFSLLKFYKEKTEIEPISEDESFFIEPTQEGANA